MVGAGQGRAAPGGSGPSALDLTVDGVHDRNGSRPDPAGAVMPARIGLRWGRLIRSDSAQPHARGFTPGTAFSVLCPDQAEVDRLWALCLDGGTPRRCGWLTDACGLSWQTVPPSLPDIVARGTPDQKARAAAAFLPIERLDGPALVDASLQDENGPPRTGGRRSAPSRGFRQTVVRVRQPSA
jgi:predicted 3-demethylubiquinone-9 3-methyltransferase (glyoxalase superfamily)